MLPSKNSSPSPQYYAVYLAKFKLRREDPDRPGPRYHHIVFVETDRHDRSGIKFHVVGDIASSTGMTYDSKKFHNPEESRSFHSKELLGYTPADALQSRWDALLGSLPTPKQKAFNPATTRTELVKSWAPLAFYAPGEERRPPGNCVEWTNNHAVPALREAGLIIEAVPAEGSALAAEGSRSAAEGSRSAAEGSRSPAEAITTSGEWALDPAYNR